MNVADLRTLHSALRSLRPSAFFRAACSNESAGNTVHVTLQASCTPRTQEQIVCPAWVHPVQREPG